LLAHTFGRVEARDRTAYLTEVERTLRLLADAGLADVIPASDWITWAARALLRADASAPEEPLPPLDHDGYRALRAAMPRVPSGFVLAEVALRTAGAALPARADPPNVPAAAELLAALPAELRPDVAAADQRRIERTVAFLEAFWSALDDGAEPPSPQ